VHRAGRRQFQFYTAFWTGAGGGGACSGSIPQPVDQRNRIPIHEDFDTSGIIAALRRNETWVAKNHPGLLRSAALPPSFFDTRVTTTTNVMSTLRTLRTLRRVRVVFDCKMNGSRLPPLPDKAPVSTTDIDASMILIMARLCYGDMLESVVRLRASRLCHCDALPSDLVKQRHLSQLMYDSYLISCWTSAHAEWIHTKTMYDQEHQTEPRRGEGVRLPLPSVSLVPYAITSLPSLCDLIEHRVLTSQRMLHTSNRMVPLLSRCTNAGCRGWGMAMTEAMSDRYGSRKLISRIAASVLTGMNPLIHPVHRPCWEQRMRTHAMVGMIDIKVFLEHSDTLSKEIVRAYFSVLMANLPATQAALHKAMHPAGRLIVSPYHLPPMSLMAAMAHLVGGPLDSPAVLQHKLSTWPKHKVTRKHRYSCRREMVRVTYSVSWLGRSQPLYTGSQRLVDEARDVVLKLYCADFLPLWKHEALHGKRVFHLDKAMYEILHHENTAHKMCGLLSAKDRMHAIRAAVSSPHGSSITTSQAMALLNPPSEGEALDPNIKVMETDATGAAKLFVFVKTTGLISKLLTYNLGPTTRKLQISAICRRLMRPKNVDETDEETLSKLPTSSTHLMVCVVCKRVANACKTDNGTNTTFNEIGEPRRTPLPCSAYVLSTHSEDTQRTDPQRKCMYCHAAGTVCCMLRVDGEVSNGHLRCSKRISTALRNARNKQQDKRAFDGVDTSSELSLASEKDHMSLLRRDQKNTFAQPSEVELCGQRPLVTVAAVGRVVRVFDQFYSICSYCGCWCTVNMHNRFGREICCLRCDVDMMRVNDTSLPAASDGIKPDIKCRYCGKVSNGAISRFRFVNAPNDTVGHNRDLPPPLRWTTFCTTHWRPWLSEALDVMSIKEVLAHISSKCRPILSASGHKRDSNHAARALDNVEEQKTSATAGRKRRRSYRSAINRMKKK